MSHLCLLVESLDFQLKGIEFESICIYYTYEFILNELNIKKIIYIYLYIDIKVSCLNLYHHIESRTRGDHITYCPSHDCKRTLTSLLNPSPATPPPHPAL